MNLRNSRWVVEQDFHGNFRVNYALCFVVVLPFSPTSLTESFSFWHGMKDLFFLHKSGDKDVLDRF